MNTLYEYIQDLLKETRNLGCKPAEIPMNKNLVQHQMKEVIPLDKGMYQRLVDKLIYLSHTRPDIACSISMVSKSMKGPNKCHLGP